MLRILKRIAIQQQQRNLSSKVACEKVLNAVTLIGRVGTKTIIAKTAQTDKVIVLSLSTDSEDKTAQQNHQNQLHRVCVYDKNLQSSVLTGVKEGDRLYVTGKICYNLVADKTSKEQQRSITTIIANELILLESLKIDK